MKNFKNYEEIERYMERNEIELKEMLIKFPYDENLQFYAIDKNCFLLDVIKNSTERVICYALSKAREPLKLYKLIKDPSENIQIAYVSNSFYGLLEIENPSRKVIFAALEYNGRNINFVKNPDEAMCLLALMDRNIINVPLVTKRVVRESVEKYPYRFFDVPRKKRNRKLLDMALSKNPEIIRGLLCVENCSDFDTNSKNYPTNLEFNIWSLMDEGIEIPYVLKTKKEYEYYIQKALDYDKKLDEGDEEIFFDKSYKNIRMDYLKENVKVFAHWHDNVMIEFIDGEWLYSYRGYYRISKGKFIESVNLEITNKDSIDYYLLISNQY